MRFIIDKSVYSGVLDKMRRALHRTEDSIYRFIYHEATAEGLRMVATDMNIKIDYTIPIGNYLTIEENGSCCVLGQKLVDLIKGYPDTNIEVSLAEEKQQGELISQRFVLEAAKGNGRKLSYWVPCSNVEGFLMGDFRFSDEIKVVKMEPSFFKKVIKKTEFATYKQQDQLELTNIKIESFNGELCAVGSDEERIAFTIGTPGYLEGDGVFYFFNAWAKEMISLLDDINPLEIATDGKIIMVKQSMMKFYSRQLAANYPDWKTNINREYANGATVNKDDLVSALKNTMNSSPVSSWIFNGDEQTLSLGSDARFGDYGAVGGGDEMIPASINGTASFATNTQYILDVLNNVEGEDVEIFFDLNGEAPLKIIMDNSFASLVGLLSEA